MERGSSIARLPFKHDSLVSSVSNCVDSDSVYWGEKKDKVSFVTVSLNYTSYPPTSLLIPQINGGNCDRQLKTL